MSGLRSLSDDASIPDVAFDIEKRPVDLRPSVWALNTSTAELRLNWERLTNCNENAVFALKVHVIRLIETKSPRHAHNAFRQVGDFLIALAKQFSAKHEIDLDSLLWYLQSLRTADAKNVWQFHHIRQWYKMSADRYIDGFDDETVYVLNDLKIPGNEKGVAVLSSDPDEGPLDEFEEMALRAALLRDRGPIPGRCLLWLALAFGPNPANLSLLRREDFKVQTFSGDLPTAYFLRMPRIKKRQIPRTDFKIRYVDEPLAAVIKELLESDPSLDDSRPFFPRFTAPTPSELKRMDLFAYHCTSSEITRLISECVRRLNVISPTTGMPLYVTTRRLRYTYATKMVRQGVTAYELAELLDHTDTQHVMVYYKADRRFVERLDATIAKHLGPTVKAFMGEIVDRPEQPKDIIPFRDLPGLGGCGASFVCDLSPPNNCYTCVKFRPFKDGPHEDVLESVIASRAELLEAGHTRIAEQLDTTIIAIGEVVASIEKTK